MSREDDEYGKQLSEYLGQLYATRGAWVSHLRVQHLEKNWPHSRLQHFDRRAYRTVVRVEEARESAGVRVAEVVVPAWNPSEVVEIPLALIGNEDSYSNEQLRGKRFMAYVNIYAEAADELYFRDFEEAPEVPEGWPD